MNIAKKIFFSLQGQWSLERTTNGHGKMQGMASFLPLEGHHLVLFYKEEGEHILENGTSVSFFRENIYCLNQDYLDVYFAHNRKRGAFFHRLFFSKNPKDCLAHGEHLCGQDLYEGTYQFIDPNRFTILYRIKGPQKNMQICTLFQRQISVISNQ